MKIERGALSDTVKRAKRESAAREILRQGRHLDLNPKPGCSRGLCGALTRTKHRTLVHRDERRYILISTVEKLISLM